MQRHYYHKIMILFQLNCIFSKLDIRTSDIRSNGVAKYPTLLRKLTCYIFPKSSMFHLTTLQVQHLNIYLLCLVEI